MPFNRPTLAEIIGRIVADIESRLPGADARLRRNVLNVLGRSLAGASHGLHGHLDWAVEQLLPDSAESEYLERWGSIWGISRKPAVASKGDVTFTGTDGAVIPAGTLLQRSDGAEYTTDADGIIAGGSATVAATASAAGADGDTATGSVLDLVNPIAGVNTQATVAAGDLGGGADIEGDDSLRVRLLARIQQPPHGGAEWDYEAWALEVSGVTRAWVYPHYLGVGTVGIIIVDDDSDPIVPDAAKVGEVQAYIDERRPVTAQALVLAPVAVSLDLTIALTPTTAAVQAAVMAELEDFFRREAIPGGTIYVSRLREAISAAEGETSHELTAPAADVAHAAGEIAVLGVVTWA
jgi:uncharacterized phage protein gp47/JayE